MKESGIKVVATNRRATHDYILEQRVEAGLVLLGTEIKSIRAGQVNLREGYAQVRDGEMWLVNVHIASYEPAAGQSHDPLRCRKLLLHRREMAKLMSRIQEQGYTLIPLRMYLKDGRAKVEIAVAHGKRKYDKREAIAKRESDRQVQRVLKERERA